MDNISRGSDGNDDTCMRHDNRKRNLEIEDDLMTGGMTNSTRFEMAVLKIEGNFRGPILTPKEKKEKKSTA